jgi:hypothetical protein
MGLQSFPSSANENIAVLVFWHGATANGEDFSLTTGMHFNKPLEYLRCDPKVQLR